MTIEIKAIASLKDNYIWTIIDNIMREVIIIDPGTVAPVEAFIEEQSLSLLAIFVTHHHWDHTNGVTALKNRYQTLVYAPQHDPVKDGDILMAEPDILRIEGFPLSFSILDIPGHTLGHIAYYSPGMLFCGDTLFAAGCGRLFPTNPFLRCHLETVRASVEQHIGKKLATSVAVFTELRKWKDGFN